MSLPEFVPPMLAKLGRAAFDSDEHLFEIKWDGTRALCFVEQGGYRLLNRHRKNLVPGYPELAFLGDLPGGSLLDGEIVILRDGKPSFHDMLVREQAQNERRARDLARSIPATYVAFDLLYRDGRSLMEEPLDRRREALAELLDGRAGARLAMSDGMVGSGRALFETTRREELEGIVAKRRSSTYESGQRTGAWTKIKTVQVLHCVVLGFVPDGPRDFRSLIVGADFDGKLECVGRVGSGIDQRARDRLNALLRESPREQPIVECPFPGEWVEPTLFCSVSYLERTRGGMLRAPVFLELLDP